MARGLPGGGKTRSWVSCLCGLLSVLHLLLRTSPPHPALVQRLLVFEEEGQLQPASVSSFLSSHMCLGTRLPFPGDHLHPCPLPSFPGASESPLLRDSLLCQFFSSQSSSCGFYCFLMKQMRSDRKLLWIWECF